MATLNAVELHVEGTRDLALMAADGSIWLVVPLRWWDLATLAWWLFAPHDRKAKVKLTLSTSKGETKVSFRAMRVASRHVRVSGVIGAI